MKVSMGPQVIMQLSIPAALPECVGPLPVLSCKGREQGTRQEAMWFLPTNQAYAEPRWLGTGCRATAHLLHRTARSRVGTESHRLQEEGPEERLQTWRNRLAWPFERPVGNRGRAGLLEAN